MFEYYESCPVFETHTGLRPELFYKRQRAYIDTEMVMHGVEAVFIPIDSVRGLKLYRCLKDGKVARECQAEAYKFDLGPQVLSPLFEFVFPYGSQHEIRQIKMFPTGKAYGYYTEIANTQRVKLDIKNTEEFEQLITDCMTLLSYRCNDLNSKNVGYIGDRLVMIDFGYHTTGDPTERPRGHFSVTGVSTKERET